MGLFDFFRKPKETPPARHFEPPPSPSAPVLELPAGEVVVYYQNGYVCKVVPYSPLPLPERLDEIYQARYIVINDTLYDLLDKESVSSIPKVRFKPPETDSFGVCGSLDYVMRIKAQSLRDSHPEQAINCLRKAIDLMDASSISWQARDYERMTEYYIRNGQFDEAEAFQKKLQKKHPELFDNGATLKKKAFQETLARCQSMHTDLVEMSAHYETCAECAKYQGRVFSISGNDKRYPPLPAVVLETGCMHPRCTHHFSPYIHGSQLFADKFNLIVGNSDPIVYSNRPFVDDRTPAQIQAWENCARAKPLPSSEERFARLKKQYYERTEYAAICEKLPALAPKSLAGYRRMKSNRTKGYLKILDAAQAIGLDLN